MSDPFDDVFAGNGASGSGLDPHEGAPVIVIPQFFQAKGFKDVSGELKDIVDVDLVNFAEVDKPWSDDGVRIFAGRLVSGFRKNAEWNKSNPDGDPDTHLPKMTVGIVKKGQKPGGGKNAPWLLEPITDKELLGKMAAYARANLKVRVSDPFSVPE